MLVARLAIAATGKTMTMDVNVTTTASITIVPTYLNWTQVATGTPGGARNLTIKNAGSVNVSQIYAYVDTLTDETLRPYETGDPSNYAAGGVIAIRNETITTYYFAGRIEWNWTQDIPNHDWSDVTTPVSWGYFRNTSDDYVWVLGSGASGRCNESDAQFSIEDDVDLGTIETRYPENTIALSPSAGDSENWGYGNITSGALSGHCVAAYQDCSKIYIFKYDKRDNFTGCANTAYLFETNLTPGNTFITTVDAWVPNGYPSGNLSTTTLTIYAASNGP
jgi:hypothetical protein